MPREPYESSHADYSWHTSTAFDHQHDNDCHGGLADQHITPITSSILRTRAERHSVANMLHHGSLVADSSSQLLLSERMASARSQNSILCTGMSSIAVPGV